MGQNWETKVRRARGRKRTNENEGKVGRASLDDAAAVVVIRLKQKKRVGDIVTTRKRGRTEGRKGKLNQPDCEAIYPVMC